MKNKLWYTKPATEWVEALPLGNGRLGSMVFGQISKERIQLNEDTLWTGKPTKNEVNQSVLLDFQEARKLILKGEYKKGEKLINKKLLGPFSESYAPMGNLYLDFGENIKYEKYVRELDLEKAAVTVKYNVEDVEFIRTVIISKPDDSLIIRLKASKSGMINFSANFDSLLKYKINFEIVNNVCALVLNGKAPIHAVPSYENDENPIIYDEEGKEGMNFKILLYPEVLNGKLSIEHGKLKVEAADEVVVKIVAHTSYNGYENEPGLQGKDVNVLCTNSINKLINKTYEKIYLDHIKDYSELFNRVDFQLESTDEAQYKPTDERINRFKEGNNDLDLFTLYFQYGRYLLISSSRPGTQPANLQGIWNEDLRPAWSSNYTTNINVEMNYWPAEVCNLSECHEPLFRMIKEISHTGSDTAKYHYGCKGWTANHNVDLWRLTTPVAKSAEWGYWPMAGAWLCSHIWEHYEFTIDKQFLKEMYPIMKGAAQFLIDFLIETEEGYLVTCPSTSPENNFITKYREKCSVSIASTMDMTLCRNLFGNCIKAINVLKKDFDFADELSNIINKLYPYKIGKHGQLQEWFKDFDEFETGHRHLSHLFGLYPSNELKYKFESAARVSLERRLENGGGHTGWSCAWVISLFARLKDSKKAYEYLKILINKLTFINMFNVCPPFQIDGNFGGTAAIAEMLLQSNDNSIKLLPALPIEWKKGYIKGLKARGGFEVDIYWQESSVKNIKVRASSDGICKIKYRKIAEALCSFQVYIKNSDEIEFYAQKGFEYDFELIM